MVAFVDDGVIAAPVGLIIVDIVREEVCFSGSEFKDTGDDEGGEGEVRIGCDGDDEVPDVQG